MVANRQRVPVQVNQFVGGLNTEANPLSFPPTASIDELNMSFNRDGSRQRRNGFDLENGYTEVETTINGQPGVRMGKSQFLWENTGGYNNVQFLVVQMGYHLAIHDLNDDTLSAEPIFRQNFNPATYSTDYEYAVVDGLLIVATGQRNITTLAYDGNSISSTISTLLVRDLFGVEATSGGIETTAADNIQNRPTALSGPHLYNLRNQTFALPRVKNNDTTDLVDLVTDFEDEAVATGKREFPSNADNAIKFIFANANSSSDREVERFHGQSMIKSPPSTTQAPVGYFIIDALHRGASRVEQEAKLRGLHPSLDKVVTGLTEDRTPGGASALAQYSGRVWYAGFSGEVVGGHKKSPRMSSYVLFSKVVQEPSDVNLCYQAADPTSVDDPDIADTDGGFIKIDGAYNIKALIPVETSLFVLAENGVWRVVGVDENTFTATSYSVSKLSNEGCISPKSAIVANKSLAYWGKDGIYQVSTDQVGTWQVTNITQDNIQTYYDVISKTDKETAVGFYDSDNLSVRWVWGELESHEYSSELVLNFRYSAFTKNQINLPNSIAGVVGLVGGQNIEGNPLADVIDEAGNTVTDGTENVQVPSAIIQRGATEAFYHVVISTGSPISYSFGRYNRPDTPYDWERYGEATDSPALLLTGSITGGDARLRKNIPYLSVYFEKTDDAERDSKCVLTAQWNWTNSFTDKKWTSPRQIYRPSSKDGVGNLFSTRNKIRGSGKSVAFRFESVPGSGMHLYGWEFNVEATAEE